VTADAEPRLDALGIALALMHAATLTVVCGTPLFTIGGWRLVAGWREIPWLTVPPAISLLCGTFLGWTLVLMSQAARRRRVGLRRCDRALLIPSGFLCGFMGVPAVLFAFFGRTVTLHAFWMTCRA
jgi:hypothetical protein